MESMDKQNQPIPIIYIEEKSNKTFTLGYLHYGNSELIRQLRWLPYLCLLYTSPSPRDQRGSRLAASA